MTNGNQNVDIAQVLGRIENVAAARRLFEERLDADNLAKIQHLTTPAVLIKIANAIALCEPAAIFVNTGRDRDRDWIRRHAIAKGEEKPLPMPQHTIHFDLKEEQGRIIDRTFYIVDPQEAVSSLALKKLRQDALEEIRREMHAIMRDKTMIIGCYIRGPAGAPVSNPALEITSSAYVSHSAEILYRNAFEQFDHLVERQGHFYTNIHSEGRNRPEDLPHARVFMDRSHRTTYSFNCTYAGNTLLLKKGNHRFSVDRSVYEKRGHELAEHMFITGIDGPDGRITWVTGAAPSGCGKTTTAMAGNHFVGDDLAQMWIDADGGIRSVNPECGIFGIVEDVNRDGDPMLMQCLREPGTEVIWSNVLVDDKGVPHWTGNGEPRPTRGTNFQGAWEEGLRDADGKAVPLSHPNARCTLASKALGNYSPRAEEPAGVETRVITYSGRDSDTMPPVWTARNAEEGVVIGACIVSAATATEVGASGVKRAPWANAPFIPGALGDYMEAQFQFFGSDRIKPAKRPVMAGLNYFLTHEARGGEGKQLLGEKRDVKVWLAWLERRAHGDVEAIETPIGLLPLYDDLRSLFATIIAKAYPSSLYDQQFSLYLDNILARIALQIEAYRKEEGIPAKLFQVLDQQRAGLEKLRRQFGPVATPAQLKTASTGS
jgi:phosphoenolpyruvate carboxykinase (GTP)